MNTEYLAKTATTITQEEASDSERNWKTALEGKGRPK